MVHGIDHPFIADVPASIHPLFVSPCILVAPVVYIQAYHKQIKNYNQCEFDRLRETVEWAVEWLGGVDDAG